MSEPTFRSVVHMFQHRVAETPDAEAMSGRYGGSWRSMTWAEAGRRARAIGCGLLSLGFQKGERGAVLATSSPEWVLADLGILSAGGATSTIYTSNTAEESAYILADSGARVCFVENPLQEAKIREVRGHAGNVMKLVLMDGAPVEDDGWTVTLAELERLGAAWDAANPGGFDRAAAAVTPEDLATLIYTSGTTGRPKGVMLTHDNWLFEAEAIADLGVLQPDDKQLLFLPLAHSFAKVLEVAFIRTGVATAVDGVVDDLVANLAAVRPTIMAGVPRVYEKVYNRVVTGAREGGGLKYKIFQWAIEVGGQVSRLRQQGRQPSGLLAFRHRLADKLVYSKLKQRLGGRLRYLISGGAPLSRSIAEFFHSCDILILEAYGLTETSAGSTSNRPGRYKFGTVGQPFKGVEIKTAEDGEILIRGRNIMKGYYNLPEATAEALDAERWLHTGDIGVIDADGFIAITDRKKDILVTAGGKNIAPQNIENQLKVSCPYVSQVVMLGDRRPFCVALITINEETVGKWAKEQGIEYKDYADLASRPEVRQLIQKGLDDVNSSLASYERIKAFHLLDHDLSQATGEMTPKMSVKRKVVEARHREILEGFYKDTVARL
ncbi:MAG TPA: long-chain fatty acid--CoA ligase [Thermoanaerobaculia bacterium]|jgi:long-chain acyl-CoA synthetase|nr:long-chain fatty acid--CoA ligase [Thermoanaerobaculia bacterium]